MKKLLFLVAGIALLAVACRAEVNVLVDINENQTGTATFEFGLDEEFKGIIESSGGTTDDLLDEVNLGAEGGVAFTRTDGDMTYSGVAKDFTDISEIMDDLSGATGADGMFDDFTFEMDDKTAELRATVTAPEQDTGDLGIDPSTLTGDVFSANFILSMPGTVVDSNADEVLADGSLRWDLPILGGDKEIYAQSEFGSSSLWWLWVLLGVALIVGVIAIIAAVGLGKRQQKEAVNDAAAQYPQSAVEAIGVAGTAGDGDVAEDSPATLEQPAEAASDDSENAGAKADSGDTDDASSTDDAAESTDSPSEED
jgi:hypothetical protein